MRPSPTSALLLTLSLCMPALAQADATTTTKAETPPVETPAETPTETPATTTTTTTTTTEPTTTTTTTTETPPTEPTPVTTTVESPPLEAMPPRAPTSGPQLEGPRDGVPDCRDSAAVCWSNDLFAIWPRLRLRSGFEAVQADSQVLTVGQNDGFFLDQVRFGVDGAFQDDLRFRFILDVTTTVPGSGPNDPVQGIAGAVRDAWVAWIPSDWFFVSAGQQFMPSDLEGSTTIAGLPFARRSAATSGVRPGHGFAVAGLSPSRQMGLVLGSTENSRLGGLSLEYLFGIGNGNGQNINGNDNKLPAAYARVGVGYDVAADIAVHVGAGGRYNPRTAGTLPNLFNETDSVGYADLSVNVVGINLAAQAIYKQTEFNTLFPTGGDGSVDTGLGATAWIFVDQPAGFDLFGVVPAYRFSYYDPSSTFSDDQLIENTLGVRWNIPALLIEGAPPLSLFVDGTLLTEIGEGVRDLDNARVTALLQLEL